MAVKCFLGVVLVGLSGVLFAEEPAECLVEKPSAAVVLSERKSSPLTGEFGVGGIQTRGNTNTSTLSAYTDLKKESRRWRNTFHYEALNKKDEDDDTAKKYQAIGKADYKLKIVGFLFVAAQRDVDHFSGYDYQDSLAVGYGRQVYKYSGKSLDLEFGPGYRRSRVAEAGQIEKDEILLVAGTYLWGVSEYASFKQAASVEFANNDELVRLETSLVSRVTGSLSMKLAYAIKRQSGVPEGTRNSDSETSLQFVYKLK